MSQRAIEFKFVLLSFFALILALPSAFSQQWELNKKYWYPDGEAKAVVHDTAKKRIYIGGNFQTMGPASPYGAQINYKNATDCDTRFANPDKPVYSVIKDNKGGWFIGGDFTRVGDSLRGRIAHINNSGEVTKLFIGDSFNQRVSSLMLRDSILYIGGSFTSLGAARLEQAVFDTSTYKIDPRFPLCNGPVTKVISDKAGGWFVAGNFTKIGDSTRKGLAYVNAAGVIGKWNPAPDSTITELFLDDTTVYIGGLFTKIGGATVYRLAAVNNKTGKAKNWNPSAGAGTYIYKLLRRGKYIYAGGYFTSMGGQTRNNLAAIDISTGLASTWNPDIKGNILTMLIVGNTIYIGGEVSYVGTTLRKRLASINLTTGAVTNWNPAPDNTVNSIQLYDRFIIAGGEFQNIGTTARKFLAAIDTSGLPTSWNPAPSALVNTCIIDGDRLFVSGYFTSIGGYAKKDVALYNMKSGVWHPWSIVPAYGVEFIALSGRSLFIGGYDGYLYEKNRNGIAAFNINTGRFLNWYPLATGTCTVSSMAYSAPGRLIIGGQFTQIGGKTRNNVARIDLATGLADNWNPNANGSVSCMQLHNGLLYLAGTYSTIGGQTRNRLAAVDTVTGSANLSFKPPAPNAAAINQIALVDSTLYIGGRVQFWGSDNRNHLASMNSRTGVVSAWHPNLNGEVFALEIKGNSVFVGGKFTIIQSSARSYVAEIDRTTGKTSLFNPLINDYVYALALADSAMYIGGNFYSAGRKVRKYLAAIDAGTGQLLDWGKNALANDYINCMLLKDTILYMGGNFTMFEQFGNYLGRWKLASLGTGNNAYVLPWAPKVHESGKTNIVYDIALKGSTLYIAGEFYAVNSIQIKHLAAVNTGSAATLTWNPRANKAVRCILLSDTTLYAGGDFDSLGGQKRLRVAAFSASYAGLRAWKPSFNKTVYDLKRDGNYIYVAGKFDTANSTYKTCFAQVHKDSGTLAPFDPHMEANNNLQEGRSIIISDSLAYLAGFFGNTNNQYGAHLSSISKTAIRGKVNWNPGMENAVNMTHMSGKLFIAGGLFSNVNGERVTGLAIFNQTCKQTSSLNINQSACRQYVLNGFTYNKSGSYKQILTNVKGCDSFIYLNLKISDSSSRKMSITSCTAYTLNGQTYTSSGKYVQKLVNVKGCDSFITLNLTYTPKTASIKVSACSSSTINGQTYSATGIYTQSLKAWNACDSILTIDLKILSPPGPYTLQANGCDSLHFNGITYTASGTYNQKLVNYRGCDSFLVLKLQIFNTSRRTVNTSACHQFTLNNITYTTSGSYTQLLKNYKFCDSILTLHLKINDSTREVIQASSCESHVLNGKTYSQSGTYIQKRQNYLGCDSVITLKFIRTYLDATVSLNGKTLTANAGGFTYQWLDCGNNFADIPGETGRTFTPLNNGSYALRISQNTCDSISSCYQVNVTGLADERFQPQVKVYPNPMQEQLIIATDKAYSEVVIKLTDITGKAIINEQLSGKLYTMNVSELKSGLYLVTLIVEGKIYNYRIVKE